MALRGESKLHHRSRTVVSVSATRNLGGEIPEFGLCTPSIVNRSLGSFPLSRQGSPPEDELSLVGVCRDRSARVTPKYAEKFRFGAAGVFATWGSQQFSQTKSSVLLWKLMFHALWGIPGLVRTSQWCVFSHITVGKATTCRKRFWNILSHFARKTRRFLHFSAIASPSETATETWR